MKTGLLAIASCALALLLAEGVLRMLSPQTLGFAYRDGRFQWVKPYPASREDYRVRSVRHLAPVPAKPRGTTRFGLLGDSYVQALSVSDVETVGARLEYHLNQASPQPFDVVAWGFGGWGLEQELRHLRERGADAELDWVVTLFHTGNDVANSSSALQKIHERQRDELVTMRLQQGRFGADSAPFFLVRCSRLNQLLSYRLALRLGASGRDDIPIHYFVYASEPDAVWRDAWRRTEEQLLKTLRVAHRLGARYAVVSASTPHGVIGAEEGVELLTRAYPAMRDLEWDLDGPDRRLAAFCARNGIPFLALEPLVREGTRRGDRFHWPVEGHWNPAGNDLAGRLIAEFLLDHSQSSRPGLRAITR